MRTRLCDRPLPPYSYVPGKFPHPISEERGHSFGRAEPPCPVPTEENWRACEPYLWGCDLFNHGYYWEAHEAWEAVWHACGQRGVLADLLKGLIKLAAAGVKAREGKTGGIRRHLLRGAELLRNVQQAVGPKRLWGIEPGVLAVTARDLAEKSEGLVMTSDEPVVVVMPLRILPEPATTY